MGHIHLVKLPASRPWHQVVELIDARAVATDVVRASAVAAERDLATAARDPVLGEAVRLLALIPQAARGGDFGEGLRALGISVPDAPMLGDLTVGTAMALERFLAQAGTRTDFSEIVRRALVGTISTLVGDALPGLFEAESADVRRAVARLGHPDGFSRAARGFYGRLLAETLGSWLDRTLSAEIGPGRRTESLDGRDAFDRALDQYCIEATRIIREFSGAWYGKTLYRDGTVTTERAVAFSAVAMKKLREELRRKRDDHA